MRLVWDDDFSIVFGVSNQNLLAFVAFLLVDPHSLFSADEILMLIVGLEQLGEFVRSALDGLCG